MQIWIVSIQIGKKNRNLEQTFEKSGLVLKILYKWLEVCHTFVCDSFDE